MGDLWQHGMLDIGWQDFQLLIFHEGSIIWKAENNLGCLCSGWETNLDVVIEGCHLGFRNILSQWRLDYRKFPLASLPHLGICTEKAPLVSLPTGISHPNWSCLQSSVISLVGLNSSVQGLLSELFLHADLKILFMVQSIIRVLFPSWF